MSTTPQAWPCRRANPSAVLTRVLNTISCSRLSTARNRCLTRPTAFLTLSVRADLLPHLTACPAPFLPPQGPSRQLSPDPPLWRPSPCQLCAKPDAGRHPAAADPEFERCHLLFLGSGSPFPATPLPPVPRFPSPPDRHAIPSLEVFLRGHRVRVEQAFCLFSSTRSSSRLSKKTIVQPINPVGGYVPSWCREAGRSPPSLWESEACMGV